MKYILIRSKPHLTLSHLGSFLFNTSGDTVRLASRKLAYLTFRTI
jgi:hypothetical protein